MSLLGGLTYRSTALPSASSLLALALPGMLAVAALPALSVWIRNR